MIELASPPLSLAWIIQKKEWNTSGDGGHVIQSANTKSIYQTHIEASDSD